MNYIDRHINGTLKKYLSQFKVVLVTGPRQVGKSTLLKTVLTEYEYVTLDDMNELDMAQNDASQFFQNHKFPLVIDEVQYAPSLFRQIKLLVDKSEKKGQVCLTGSQTYELMQNVSESLAGRIGILELSSFSLREIHSEKFTAPFLPTDSYIEERKHHLTAEENIWHRIFRGSMPELNDETVNWNFFYSSYVKSYIERDVRKIINVKNENLFYKFIVALASRTAELFVPNDIANSLGISLQTVQAWTSVLEASGIIFILHPYENNVFKRAIKTPKIYFMDTGLVCNLIGWNSEDVLKNGAMAGSIFETFVVSEIIKSYRNAGLDLRNFFFYRDRDQKEIDMLIVQNNVIYPIEIKKAAQPALKMAKNFPAIKEIPGMKTAGGCIICLAEKETKCTDGITVLPVQFV